MSIAWARVAEEIRKRREKAKLTQDDLAAKVGVRVSTIGRIEISLRRPSLLLLERLAALFNCQVRDLLREEKQMLANNVEATREPSLKGAPSYFRYGVTEAQRRSILGYNTEGRAIRADYSHPGWHLGIHAEGYLTEEALQTLHELCHRIEEQERDGRHADARFVPALEQFLEQEFPACMALIPRRRRQQFMQGILRAIADERFSVPYNVEPLLERDTH